MRLQNLNEVAIDFDGSNAFNLIDGTKVDWSLAQVIKHLMKNLANGGEATFDERMMASQIGHRVRVADDSVVLSVDEFKLLNDTGKRDLPPILMEVFFSNMGECEANGE